MGGPFRETTLPVIFATAHLVGKELLPYEDEIRSVEGRGAGRGGPASQPTDLHQGQHDIEMANRRRVFPIGIERDNHHFLFRA